MGSSLFKNNSRKLQSAFFLSYSIIIALIDKAPLQLDQRIGTHYITDGFYLMYNGILNGTMEAPYPYRFLMPRIVEIMSSMLDYSPISICILINIFTIFLVFHLFSIYTRNFLSEFEGFLTTIILGFFITIIQTQLMGVLIVETQDIVNAFFFVLLLILGQKKRWIIFGIIIALSITNRETNLILLLPFSVLLFREKNYLPLLYINSMGWVTAILIRFLINVNESDYPNFSNLKTNFPGLNVDYINKALEFNLHLFSFIFLIVIFSFFNYKKQNFYIKTLIITCLIFIAIHYIMGSIIELRLFLPLVILILPIAVKNIKAIFENEPKHNI